MVTENVSRRERLGRLLFDTSHRVYEWASWETWETIRDEHREMTRTIAADIAAAVDAEYAPLLEAVKGMVEAIDAMSFTRSQIAAMEAYRSIRNAQEES